MRKLMLLLLFVVVSGVAFAQSNYYFRFSVGTGYLMNAKLEDTPLIMLEAGKSFGWLDAGISVNYAHKYENHSPLIRYTSILGIYSVWGLEGKVSADIIKMFFPDVRHSLRLGAGLGVVYDRTELPYILLNERKYGSPFYPGASTSVRYEYKAMSDGWIGLFFASREYDNYLGISFRKDF